MEEFNGVVDDVKTFIMFFKRALTTFYDMKSKDLR